MADLERFCQLFKKGTPNRSVADAACADMWMRCRSPKEWRDNDIAGLRERRVQAQNHLEYVMWTLRLAEYEQMQGNADAACKLLESKELEPMTPFARARFERLRAAL